MYYPFCSLWSSREDSFFVFLGETGFSDNRHNATTLVCHSGGEKRSFLQQQINKNYLCTVCSFVPMREILFVRSSFPLYIEHTTFFCLNPRFSFSFLCIGHSPKPRPRFPLSLSLAFTQNFLLPFFYCAVKDEEFVVVLNNAIGFLIFHVFF